MTAPGHPSPSDQSGRPVSGPTTRTFRPGSGFIVLVVTAILIVVLALAAAVTAALGVRAVSSVLGGAALIIVGVGLLAVLQSSILVVLLLGPLGIELTGPPWALLLLSFLGAVIGVAFGLLASAFARTEFQAVQFMPVFITPQVFLCGLLVPKEQLPDVLEAIANWLPMTWAVDVVRDVLTNPELSSDSWWRFAALAGVIVAALLIAAASMPRKTR